MTFRTLDCQHGLLPPGVPFRAREKSGGLLAPNFSHARKVMPTTQAMHTDRLSNVYKMDFTFFCSKRSFFSVYLNSLSPGTNYKDKILVLAVLIPVQV